MMSFIDLEVQSIIKRDWIKTFEGKKILITGASGLICNYLVALFRNISFELQGNIDVHLVARSTLDYSSSRFTPSVHFLDLTELEDADLQSWPDFDFVVHGATYGQPQRFLNAPLETVILNSQTVWKLLKKLKTDGTFLFLSSSEVYSGLRTSPFKEDQIGTTNTDHPRSPYIEAKRIGECILNIHGKEFSDSRVISARIALTYGPGFRENDTRVLNQFITQALKTGSIRMKDSGKALRTYCYILDSAEILIELLVHAKSGIYNVGGTSKTSILDLARVISKLTESSLEVPQDVPQALLGAPDDVSLDLEKTLALTGKTKFIDLNDGLGRTVEWAKKYLFGDATNNPSLRVDSIE